MWPGPARLGADDRATVQSSATVSPSGSTRGPPMASGDSVWARWTAAPGTLLVRLSATWSAASDLRPDRGQGTAQLTAATDRQALLAQNTPFSVGFGVSGAPPFTASVLPARWFEIRFTCLDRCATDATARRSTRTCSALGSTSTTPRRRSAGSRARRRTRRRGARVDALRPQRARTSAAACIARSSRSMAPTPSSCRSSDPRGTCHDSARDPAIPRVRRRAAVPAAHRQRLAGHRHGEAAAGPHSVRVLLEDAAGNRTAIFGPGHAEHHRERGDRARVGSGAAGRRQRRRGERPRRG